MTKAEKEALELAKKANQTATEQQADNTEEAVRDVERPTLTMEIHDVHIMEYLDPTDKRHGQASKGRVKAPFIMIENNQLLSDVYMEGKTPKGIDIRFYVGQATFDRFRLNARRIIHNGTYQVQGCLYVKEGEVMESETREDWTADRDIIFGGTAICMDAFDD